MTSAAGEILIADDSRVNVGLLTAILRQRYRLRQAGDGPSALEAIRQAPPDLVLLDSRLPGIDGYEVCRRLKADPATRDIPVIFISALDHEVGDSWTRRTLEEGSDKLKAFEAGGADYVLNPFQSAEVLARVEKELRAYRLRRQIAQKESELEQAKRRLEALSHVDSLTGIANRRHWEEFCDQEWRRARRAQASVALVVAQIDLFREFAEAYGGAAGEGCLRRVAVELSATLRRGGDLVARYGGEEFAVILPATAAAGGRVVAEEMRARVERLGVPHGGSPHRVVTLSLGVVAAAPQGTEPRDMLMAAAERALQHAKADGGNRVSVAGG